MTKMNYIKSAAILLALSGYIVSAASVREIRCDFTRGIPSDWTLIDNDGNKLSPDVTRFGFSQGDSWIAYQVASEDNAVACSTSGMPSRERRQTG